MKKFFMKFNTISAIQCNFISCCRQFFVYAVISQEIQNHTKYELNANSTPQIIVFQFVCVLIFRLITRGVL